MQFLSRDWVTPLVVGVFTLMAATGILMFFHLDSHLQQDVHEWCGWLLLAAVAGHATANWAGLKRHLQRPAWTRGLLGAGLLVFGATFLAGAGKDDEGGSPPKIALRAITGSPLRQVAPLFGKTPEQAQRDLAAAGVVLAGTDRSLASVIGDDHERTEDALRALATPAAARTAP